MQLLGLLRYAFSKKYLYDIRKICRTDSDKVTTQTAKVGVSGDSNVKANDKTELSLSYALNTSRLYSLKEQSLQRKIKQSIKSASLYYLYRSNRLQLTPTLKINLLLKLLQIRDASREERSDSTRFLQLLSDLAPAIVDAPPEDLIKLLVGIFYLQINEYQVALMQNLLAKVLQQFINQDEQTFKVISVKHNVKLMRGLMTLLKINLTLSERINQILSKLVPYLAGVILEKEKDNEGESYWMVLEEILLALSRLQFPGGQKLAERVAHRWLGKKMFINLSHCLRTEKNMYRYRSWWTGNVKRTVRNYIRQMSSNSTLRIMNLVAKLSQTKQQFLKADPQMVLQHVEFMLLPEYSKETIIFFELQHTYAKTFFNLIHFTFEAYKAEFYKPPTPEPESYIQLDWIAKIRKSRQLYLGKVLTFIQRVNPEFLPVFEVQKLLRLLSENIYQLCFTEKCSLMLFGLQKGFKNMDIIAKMVFSQTGDFRHKETLTLFTKVLEHWDKVTPIALLDYNNERDKIYFTMLMKHITKVGRIEWVANVLANFIGDSPIRLGVFLKAFHIAQEYTQNFINTDIAKIAELNMELQRECELMESNDDHPRNKVLHKLKVIIKQRLQTSLFICKLTILVLENLASKYNANYVDVTKSELFKEILWNFQQQLTLLYFPQLMSVKVIECLLEIAMYLQARSVDLSEILVKCLEIKRIKDVKQLSLMRIRTIKESQDYISFSDSPVLTNELSVHEKFDKETIAERFVDLDFERRVGLQLYESQQQLDYAQAYLQMDACTYRPYGIMIVRRLLLSVPSKVAGKKSTVEKKN